MKALLFVIALLTIIGLNALGLASGDTRFASVNDYRARHAPKHDPCQFKSQMRVVNSTGSWTVNVCGQITRG